jgi:hypothetical protein
VQGATSPYEWVPQHVALVIPNATMYRAQPGHRSGSHDGLKISVLLNLSFLRASCWKATLAAASVISVPDLPPSTKSGHAFPCPAPQVLHELGSVASCPDEVSKFRSGGFERRPCGRPATWGAVPLANGRRWTRPPLVLLAT